MGGGGEAIRSVATSKLRCMPRAMWPVEVVTPKNTNQEEHEFGCQSIEWALQSASDKRGQENGSANTIFDLSF